VCRVTNRVTPSPSDWSDGGGEEMVTEERGGGRGQRQCGWCKAVVGAPPPRRPVVYCWQWQ
jgi:hypothetical protein